MKKCGNCKYYLVGSDDGWCRRHARTLVWDKYENKEIVDFPRTLYLDWCGDWKELIIPSKYKCIHCNVIGVSEGFMGKCPVCLAKSIRDNRLYGTPITTK